MSHQATTWALYGVARDVVSDSARMTLLALADHTDPDGRGAFPSVQRLAERLGRTRRTIERHIEELHAAGLIVPGDQELVAHVRADRRPNVWDLAMTVPEVSADDDPTRVTRRSPRPDTVCRNDPTPGVADDPTPGVVQNHQRTTREPGRRHVVAAIGICDSCGLQHDRGTTPCREHVPPPADFRARLRAVTKAVSA